MNKWKVTAIIFIILFSLETLAVFYLYSIGEEVIAKENECMVNVCGDDIYDAWLYDRYDEICYCYTNHEITHQEYIK